MKKLIIVIFICACFPFYKGQAQVNYVLNGGLEQYSSCPTGYDQIKLANYWQPLDSAVIFYPDCAGEYCNACSGSGITCTGVPVGCGYNHYPRTGNGMMQLRVYFDYGFPSSIDHDYSVGKLYTHLTSGKSYCITFYTTLAQISQYAINKVGAYIDDGSISAGQDSSGCALPHPLIAPQAFAATIIDDTLNWVKVQGSFTAIGTERFITLGNFNNNTNTDTIRRHPSTSNNFSWYLIDDVSVIASDAVADAGTSHLMGLGDSTHIGTYEEGMPCTWYVLGNPTPIGYGGGMYVHPTVTTSYVVALDLCSGITYDTATIYVCPAGVSALSFPGELLQLYPNPATTELHIDHAANCEVTITNLLGQQALRTRLMNDKAVVNIEGLAKGIYTALLTDPATGSGVVRKVVVSR